MVSIILIIGGLLSMGFTNPSSAKGANQIDEEQGFTLQDVEEFHVHMASESIRVYQAEAGSDVRFHYYGWSIPPRHMLTKLVNGVLNISADGLFSIGQLKLDIYLPADFSKDIFLYSASGSIITDALDVTQLELGTASGRIQADNINANTVEIDSSSGSLNIESLQANIVKLKTQSGRIQVNQSVVEEVKVTTASGDITLKDVEGNLDVNTASGHVDISYKTFLENRINVRNTSGQINLGLPVDASFILDAHSVSGSVQSDFQVNTQKAPGKISAYGQLGEGTGSVSLSTTSGRIKLFQLH